MAAFNQHASQDRDYHKNGTEVYMVLEGSMIIEEEIQPHAGYMVIVNSGSVHEVKPDSSRFICRVITIGCQGEHDKFVVK